MYDADTFDDFNDDVSPHLTQIRDAVTSHHPTTPTLSQIDAVINNLQIQSPTSTASYTFQDLHHHYDHAYIKKLRFRIEEPQMDSGANKSVTNDKSLLRDYCTIEPIPVYGVGDNEVACNLVGRGYYDLHNSAGTSLPICIYYSPTCSGTIISPNAVVRDHEQFTSWTQTSHLDTGVATVSFFHRYRPQIKVTIILHMQNSLWYMNHHDKPSIAQICSTASGYVCPSQDEHPTEIYSLRKHTEYELGHQRLLHAGHRSMDYLHKCTHGVPSLRRHDFHSCKICHEMNITKTTNKQCSFPSVNAFGQRFQLDFGFMKAQHGDKTNIRSHEGFNSYLLIVDYYTRYIWVFLTKNKTPPLRIVTQFLNTYGNKNGVRIIKTDQGGELARSHAFKQVLDKAGYALEITGSDNSSQNSIAERPHRTLGNMVRAGLENAGLHPRFWSDALLHAVHVKNRLPHAAFEHKITPYEKLTGMKPDLSNLRIFGCPITTRKPGKRTPKISKHSYNGVFLRYAKTMRNIVYFDKNSRKIKTTTYAKFDEAHYSHANKPPGAQLLMELGMRPDASPKVIPLTSTTLNIVKRHPNAITPTKGSDHAAGYDLYAVEHVIIPPKGLALIDTGISAQFPTSTYGRIASRSGLALKHSIETKGGVIDPDYTGSIKAILYNFGDSSYAVQQGERVAQLILESYIHADIKESDELPTTTRATNGFGSSGKLAPSSMTTTPNEKSTDSTTPHIIPADESTSIHCCPTPPISDNSVHIHTMDTVSENVNACDIEMDWNRPIFTTTIRIQNTGNHPTRGFHLKQDEYGPLITQCIRGTPAAKIPNWRRMVKGATIHSINDHLIKDMDDVISFFKSDKTKIVSIKLIQPNPTAVHDDTGLPQLNFDQFINVAAYHQDIIGENIKFIVDQEMDDNSHIQISKMIKNTLTRTKLQKRPDWSKWEQSEFLQLDQYDRQNMFGLPGPIPADIENPSILPMIWVYIIKVDGRYKARCVANGAPHLKGSLTLAQTYAACLEQSGCRIFWSLCASKNKTIYGADAANAFAEAPPPESRLWLKIDDAYRNWWKHKHGEELPRDTYVECHHAIQGHPESPRLWQLHIDSILLKLGFKPTHHEPCIYRNTTKRFGEDEIFLLRQVDDFAVACDSQRTAENVWDALDEYLSEPLKRESSYVKRHNGIDIDQTKWFIKVHCQTYIEKICKSKSFSFDNIHSKPIPLSADNAFMSKLETSGSVDATLIKQLEDKYGFKYRTATGELIFAMVTCRPDIGFAVMKLSQFNNSPTDAHFSAIQDVYRYLHATKSEGLTFWRSAPNMDLPSSPFPSIQTESYTPNIPPETHVSGIAYGLADSDFASDRRTRRSVGGVGVILNGATVVYKTMLQRTVALSSTEAEFYALAEAGKIILYVRSVLNDLNMPQNLATVIYEDNRGCLKMTQAMKPTRRTRHVDTRYFAILNWIETDQLHIKKIDTADNASDVLTKALGRILFYRHTDTLMGRRPPSYVSTGCD